MNDCEKQEKTSMMYIHDISKMFFGRLRKYSEELGIPSGYRRILISLVHSDGLTQFELAKLSHLTPPTVSVTLQKMEHDGLIKRVPDELDQRQMRVFLTEKGRQDERANKRKADETEETVLSCLSPEERAVLRGYLARIYDSMAENADNFYTEEREITPDEKMV